MFNRIIAAAAVGTMIIASPAVAGDNAQKTTISFADLNLNSEAGQAELERRAMKAARAVCEADSVRTGSRVLSNDKRKCLANAKKSAKQQVAFIIEDARRGG